MSNWKLVKLNFGRTPAHFGELGIGIEETSERVRSDTLFSAWSSAYARLFGKDGIEELLQRFLDSATPPVRMSSTFIYRQDGDRTIYYLPRPLKFPINYPADDEVDDETEKGDLKFFKTYKKLSYLPLDVWRRWYQGVGFIKGDREELIAETKGKSNGHLRQAGTFDYKKAYEIDQVPKIAVDRVTRATNLYHTGFVQFRSEQNGNDFKSLTGLYFLLHFPEADEKLADNFHAALHFLGEEGIGGERSSGAGRFDVEWLELPETWRKVVDFSGQNVHHCLVSLFWDDEPSTLKRLIADAQHTSYEIQERGGWIGTPFSGRQLRRQMVRMFAEGSVFPEQPQGKLANVTPREFITPQGYRPHAIYRSGISLSLPIVSV
jgi:CRISPR-associated protein Csm4